MQYCRRSPAPPGYEKAPRGCAAYSVWSTARAVSTSRPSPVAPICPCCRGRKIIPTAELDVIRYQLAAFAQRRPVVDVKPAEGQQGFISFAHKSADEMLAINGQLTAMGLCIREILPAFNTYEGAQILAGSSQMLHVHTSTSTRPTWTEDPTTPIYTAECKRGGRRR